MAQQTINVGTVANDKTGDYPREAGQKINANFTELYGSISGFAPLASPTFTGTPAAPTAAPGTNTTQLATTAFVAAAIVSGMVGLLDLKGATDCSANPNYPVASKGDAYVVSVAGKIGGASGTATDAGDWFVAIADNAGGTEAAVGASWGHVEHNLVGALLAANNLSDLADKKVARSNLGIARKYVTGRYYVPDGFSQLTAPGTAPGSGTLCLIPGYIPESATVSSLAARIVTAAASGHFQLYVYAADATTQDPTGAPIISTAALSTASATTVEDASISPTTIGPGLYWFGIICDASAATAAFAAPPAGLLALHQRSGARSLSNALFALTCWTATATYGSPPTLTGNLATDGFTVQTTAKAALVSFKVG